MAQESSGTSESYDLVQFPDLPTAPAIEEEEQYQVMVNAADRRGGLRPGEDLTALPSNHPPPPGNWHSEGRIVAPASGREYTIYTQHPPVQQEMAFSDDEADVITAKPPGGSASNAIPGDGAPRSVPPGSDALNDIDNNFSPTQAPDDTTAKCAAGFAKGFVSGFAVGLGVGFVLGLLGPIGAAIGVGMLLYSVYEVATNWDAIQALPPEKKWEMVGNLAGGILGGGLGAKGGLAARARLKPAPRVSPPTGPEVPPKGTGAKFKEAKLKSHFEDHGEDFGAKTPEEYQQQADNFLTSPKKQGVLQKTRANGDIVRYNPKTEEFGVVSKDGAIRTYYEPDPSIHGYPTNLDYFNAQ